MGLSALNWAPHLDVGSPFSSYKVVDKKTLNFFEVGVNSNKYYTIELHEGANGVYRIFSEYGRLGVTSTKQVRGNSGISASLARSEFSAIVHEKTKKGYVEIELAQSSTGSAEAQKMIDANEVIAAPTTIKAENRSNLEPEVRKLVQHIFDESGAALSSFINGQATLDQKAPLGKLSNKQIGMGRAALEEIAKSIKIHDAPMIQSLSEQYRRIIPRSFGSRKISLEDVLIGNDDKISMELDLLKFYEDSLRMEDVIVSDDIDKRYDSLYSDLWAIPRGSGLWRHLEDYMINSQSNHHSVKLSAVNMFGVKQKRAPAFKEGIGNVKELFHGSRTANLPGILSSFLKLPTQLSGVYITGAMFGPGIYFADQSTKSTQYACSRFGGRQNAHPTAFLFVADVACGRIKEERNSVYHLKAPSGFDSVKGVAGSSLLHNEFIVYDSGQQAIRYIIEFASTNR